MTNIEKRINFVEHTTSIDNMLSQWKTYEELKAKLRGKDDFVTFKTKDGDMETPTKKWRVKLERFFGISVEIVDIKETILKNNEIIYTVKARATHPTGAYHEAMGICSTEEKTHSKARKFHDALTHAETRAKNRAVFEFVGMGEVSAEEIETDNYITQKQRDYIKHLLTSKIHKDINKAEEIIRIKIDDIDKDMAINLIEKLKSLITLKQKDEIAKLAKEKGIENFKEFLIDNDINPYAIEKKDYNYLLNILNG